MIISAFDGSTSFLSGVFLREQLDKNYAIRIGDGRPPPTWMEASELGKHLKSLGVLQSPLAHAYGSPAGFVPLREHLAFMLAERSIDVSPAQILITQGGNHALELIVRHLVQPGDSVLVDGPGYYPLFGKLKLANAELASVHRTPDGPDLD
jgi:DNA-binding transcriptional MocR family regulator